MARFVEILLERDPKPTSIQQIYDRTGTSKATLSRNKKKLLSRKPPEIIEITERKKISLGGPSPRGEKTIKRYKINRKHPWYSLEDNGGKK